MDVFDADGRQPPVDHALLVAAAAVAQASSATALLAERLAKKPRFPSACGLAGLVGMYAGPAAGGGVPAPGSFHPEVARARPRRRGQD